MLHHCCGRHTKYTYHLREDSDVMNWWVFFLLLRFFMEGYGISQKSDEMLCIWSTTYKFHTVLNCTAHKRLPPSPWKKKYDLAPLYYSYLFLPPSFLSWSGSLSPIYTSTQPHTLAHTHTHVVSLHLTHVHTYSLPLAHSLTHTFPSHTHHLTHTLFLTYSLPPPP